MHHESRVRWSTGVGVLSSTRTRARITTYKGRDICRIDVAASAAPVWARTSTAERTFYVRFSNSTRELPEGEVPGYCDIRWGT